MRFPQWRTIGLHAVSAVGGGLAVLSFAASHGVDLYAIVDQVNVVVREVTKLVALAVPVISGAYAAYKASTREKLNDVASDPEVKGVITDAYMAAAVPSAKVVASVAALPAAAKAQG